MCNKWKCILCLAASAVLAVSAQAAEGPVPEIGTVELLLLRQESVQQELKIGTQEAAAIRDFTTQQHKKAMKAEKLDEAQRDRQYDQMAEENEAFLKKNLKPAQHERLNQIAMQRAGLLWVTHKSVSAKLSLSDKQKEQAKAEQLKARTETDAALAATGDERTKKLKELNENSSQRLKKLLTSEQQAKWDELVGQPFKGEFAFE